MTSKGAPLWRVNFNSLNQVLPLPRNLHFEVHKVLYLPQSLHFEVHKVLYLPRSLHFEVHKVLYLPRNLHFKVHKALRLPRNLRIEGHRALCLLRKLQTSHMSKSDDSLHLSRNLSSSTITTCHENCIDPLHACMSRKVEFGAPKREVSLAPATKSDHHERKMRTAPQQDERGRACAVQMHIDNFERHECSVNSSELAAHARALQRSKR